VWKPTQDWREPIRRALNAKDTSVVIELDKLPEFPWVRYINGGTFPFSDKCWTGFTLCTQSQAFSLVSPKNETSAFQ
jgi:hypothetical protein